VECSIYLSSGEYMFGITISMLLDETEI
jgi:hypothetical protein